MIIILDECIEMILDLFHPQEAFMQALVCKQWFHKVFRKKRTWTTWIGVLCTSKSRIDWALSNGYFNHINTQIINIVIKETQ